MDCQAIRIWPLSLECFQVHVCLLSLLLRGPAGGRILCRIIPLDKHCHVRQVVQRASGDGIDFDTLNEILEILKDDYFGRDFLSDEQLFEAAINGMLDSLADTGTFYIDPTTFEFAPDASGTYEGIGATVSVTKAERKRQEFTIVGSTEADPAKGRISNESPGGRALLGKGVGDEVLVDVPKGAMRFTVTKIS